MSSSIKKIICLASSRKSSGRCVVGVEILENNKYGSWVRPVSSRIGEEISNSDRRYENKTYPMLLDIIGIPIKCHKPNLFQTENHLINDEYYWEQNGKFSVNKLPQLCNQPKSLWGTGDSSYQGTNDRIHKDKTSIITESIYLIMPQKFDVLVRSEGEEFGDPPRRKVRGEILYNDSRYVLPVTDPEKEEYFFEKPNGKYPITTQNNNVFICVSLGGPHTDDKCYKFIASFFVYE